MFSKWASFRELQFDNLCEQQCDREDSRFGSPLPFNGKQVDPTAYEELQGFEEFVTSRNAKVDVRDYEISFESNFLEEHENAFKIQTKNFIESTFKNSDEQVISLECEEIFGGNLQFSSLENEQDGLTKSALVSNFLKQAKTADKFMQYVDFIYKTVPKQFANEFVLLASEAWKVHHEQTVETSESEILERAKILAEEKTETLFNDQRISFLNLRIVSECELYPQLLVKQAFKAYIESFFSTVMLIAEEYFQNPYGESEDSKRERCFRLEEDDDDLDHSSTHSFTFGRPTKKQH